jgi:dethiobiotin synthetase
MRIYITGTDTDVGKTRVTAAVARAYGIRAIVKLVQTGLPVGADGDAMHAAWLADGEAFEFARYALPADPWNAAIAEGAEPPVAAVLTAKLAALGTPYVAEGAGGAAVPLNAVESITDVAALAQAQAVIAVGLRLGCISHALLTLEYLRARAIPVLGAVLTERWAPVDRAYRAQVERAFAGRIPILAVMPYDDDARRSVAAAAEQIAR